MFKIVSCVVILVTIIWLIVCVGLGVLSIIILVLIWIVWSIRRIVGSIGLSVPLIIVLEILTDVLSRLGVEGCLVLVRLAIRVLKWSPIIAGVIITIWAIGISCVVISIISLVIVYSILIEIRNSVRCVLSSICLSKCSCDLTTVFG